MSVSEGMDVERVRSIAGQLGASGERLRTVRGEGSASMAILDSAWAGADRGGFSNGWTSSAGSLEAAAAALQHLQRELLRQAEEQDTASGGAGDGGRGERLDHGEVVDDLFDDLFGGGGDGGGGDGWRPPTPIDGLGDAWDRGTDALEDTWDWGVDRGRDLVEWGRDGLDWVGDRGAQLAGVTRDFWDDEVLARWDAGAQALARLGPSTSALGEQLTQIVTDGRWPRFHEVAASALLLGGRTVGVAANVLTGEDQRLLHSGEGVVTSRSTLPADPELEGRIPSDLNAVMEIQNDTYDTTDGRESERRHVRVTEVAQPDGSSAHIVTVPGTNGLTQFPGSITGGDEAFDNTSNLELQAGERSASMEAVMAAMQEAGIEPGEPVMLQGHSQGGMVVAELTQDPEFMDRYTVTHMITEGSPNDSRSIPDGVQTLALEHTNDPVPMVDLGDAYAGPPVPIPMPGPLPPVILPMTPIPHVDPALAGSGAHVTQVRLDPEPGVTLTGGDLDSAHHYRNYSESVAREIAAGHHDLVAYALSPGIDVFLTDDPSAVHITEYGTGRE
ncbi:hypothetical protein [Janibacter sp. GS2]|uniref:hypothetical protein n=1 Tax=Janibacter sp. GS2 TaxID=3442646 RepID=UPI003EB7D7BD